MTHSYKLSNLARNDLEDIWAYTLNNWSLDQTNFYYELLITEIENLCHNPYLSKSISHIHPVYRLKIVKSHVIIFMIKDNVLLIDRILHQSMDAKSYLDD